MKSKFVYGSRNDTFPSRFWRQILLMHLSDVGKIRDVSFSGNYGGESEFVHRSHDVSFPAKFWGQPY